MSAKNNTWVLITGASGGFGEEFARQYAAQGKSLILVARQFSKLDALARELRQHFKVDVMVEQVDLSVMSEVSDLHHRLQELDIQVDILINNAGYGLQVSVQQEPY